MKPVIACLILYIQDDEHRTGKPKAQAYNINDRIDPVAKKVSESGFEIIFYHGFCFYSVLNDFTGLAIAALMAWKLTVTIVIAIAITDANTKIPGPILTRY